jgi:hypothetical protein
MRVGGSSAARIVLAAVIAAVLVVFVLLGVEIARGRGAADSAAGAIELEGGVPVGVEHTPAGALAAADNYLADSSQTLEQDPSAFGALVRRVYAPVYRAQTLAHAEQLRLGDGAGMTNYAEGGHGLAVVAARRLDSYSPSSAAVTSWLAGFVWGPHLSPRQSWNLVDTTLGWRSGRWLVVSSQTDPTPAPVPAVVYVDGSNDSSAAFGRLAGMTAPFYGSGG